MSHVDFLIDRDVLLREFVAELEGVGFFSGTVKGEESYTAKYKEAETAFDSKLADLYKTMGNEFVGKKEFRQAIEFYKVSTFLHPTPLVNCNLAAVYYAVGDPEMSIEYCNKSLELDPNYSKSYNRLGLNYLKQNKLEEAKKAIERAIELEPDNKKYKQELSKVNEAIEKLKEQDSEKEQP